VKFCARMTIRKWSSLALGLGCASAGAYICFFNYFHFLSLDVLKKRLTERKSRRRFLMNLFSPGFIRSSIRHFISYYKCVLSGVSFAEVGKIAPSAQIADLTGRVLFIESFVSKLRTNQPLILNMGSYS
jgi:hypothetical protein